jgi:hypothetical protein
MAKRKGHTAARQRTVVPYPAPKSDRCHQLMLGVIKGLGKLPVDDDWIEDRVLACLLIAWGELAAMQDSQRRDEIVGSLTTLGRRVVGKLLAANEQMATRAESTGQSVVDVLLEAVREGTAEEFPLPKGEDESR